MDACKAEWYNYNQDRIVVTPLFPADFHFIIYPRKTLYVNTGVDPQSLQGVLYTYKIQKIKVTQLQ